MLNVLSLMPKILAVTFWCAFDMKFKPKSMFDIELCKYSYICLFDCEDVVFEK